MANKTHSKKVSRDALDLLVLHIFHFLTMTGTRSQSVAMVHYWVNRAVHDGKIDKYAPPSDAINEMCDAHEGLEFEDGITGASASSRSLGIPASSMITCDLWKFRADSRACDARRDFINSRTNESFAGYLGIVISDHDNLYLTVNKVRGSIKRLVKANLIWCLSPQYKSTKLEYGIPTEEERQDFAAKQEVLKESEAMVAQLTRLGFIDVVSYVSPYDGRGRITMCLKDIRRLIG